jgi:hypothetical protein
LPGFFSLGVKIESSVWKRIRRILEKGSKNYPWNVQSLLEKLKKGTIRMRWREKEMLEKRCWKKREKKKNFWIPILCP